MRYVFAGESHGPCLTAIVEDVPAGLRVSESQINSDLARRQSGYGRGGRQSIERDTVQVTSGIRFGKTIGSPVTLVVRNRDWENWTDRMAVFGEEPEGLVREVTPTIAATFSSARAPARPPLAWRRPVSRANSLLIWASRCSRM